MKEHNQERFLHSGEADLSARAAEASAPDVPLPNASDSSLEVSVIGRLNGRFSGKHLAAIAATLTALAWALLSR